MKKTAFLFVIFFALTALGAQTPGGEARASGSTLYAAAKTVNVKASSGFFARVIGTLALGEAVTLIRDGGKWLIIRGASGLEGYAPADAFGTRRIINTGSGITAAEFAMAGKGFTDDLEQLVRSSGDVDYSEVDAMEKRTVSPEELRAFLAEGRLAAGE